MPVNRSVLVVRRDDDGRISANISKNGGITRFVKGVFPLAILAYDHVVFRICRPGSPRYQPYKAKQQGCNTYEEPHPERCRM